MSNQPAAIRGTFADFRLIKSRKVAQLVVELPIEEADAALATLGGLPQPAAERWVALARLNGSAKLPEPETSNTKMSFEAVIRCKDPQFWQFLRSVVGFKIHNENDAANQVRRLCEVSSRSGLNSDPDAVGKWRSLDARFLAWRME